MADLACPECEARKAIVTDSRPTHLLGAEAIRRRRKCPACKHAWTTYEIPAERLLYLAQDEGDELMEGVSQ